MNFRLKMSMTAFIFIVGIFAIPVYAEMDCNLPENRNACLQELERTESEIKNLNSQLTKLKSEGSSIERDKKILENQIQQSKLKIKQHELSIATLGKNIKTKENTITGLQQKITRNKVGLKEVIRSAYEIDNISPVEIFLSNENLSDFIRDIDAYGFINTKIRESIGIINKDKQEEEREKKELDNQRAKEYDSKYEVELQKKKVDAANAEKARLLSLNKKEQSNYSAVISDKQAKANKIRNALFALRDSGSIKFEDAVRYAKAASAQTGVRASFILAILQQESNLGSNVGSCYLKNTEDGSGVRISTGAAVKNIMKASRDIQPFLAITKALGRDPFTTRVSCPLASGGFGGAMGPAQFIPSTWQLFAARISKAKGGGVANPWAAADAFMASSMYLADLGASSGSYSAERNAACRYYSGRACGSSGNTFYGDQVMQRAVKLQADIDLIQ